MNAGIQHTPNTLYTTYENHAKWHMYQAFHATNERRAEWHATQADEYFRFAKFYRKHRR
jgi:hypothetical protein